LDVGSNLGQYALYAAKIGRDVIAVEPFHDNILRIHKAAKTENIANKITLIKNGISNKRNMIMELVADSKNIGGQYLKENTALQTSKDKSNNYIVQTILFDDMIDYFPKRSDGSSYDKAIIKIDIEGFEVYAFEKSDTFFKNYKVQMIFMEWNKIPTLTQEAQPLIEKMFKLFYSSNLLPFSVQGSPLQKESWRNWPQDVVWKK
jgi:FkbM family methyltransferase